MYDLFFAPVPVTAIAIFLRSVVGWVTMRRASTVERINICPSSQFHLCGYLNHRAPSGHGGLRNFRVDWKKSVLTGMSDYAGLGIGGD